jgi:formaldehyde-activating enzyme involved in methanogenesis
MMEPFGLDRSFRLGHVNIVVGGRNGPVGTSLATALATPRAGHTRFMVVV